MLVSGSVWVPALAHAVSDTILLLEIDLLAPGFNGYFVGTMNAMLGWVVLGAFIVWLVWTGRLPVQMEQTEGSHIPIALTPASS